MCLGMMSEGKILTADSIKTCHMEGKGVLGDLEITSQKPGRGV